MSYLQVQNTNILKKLSNKDKYRIYLFTDIVFDKTAKITKIQKQNLKEKGEIAVIDQGQKFIAGYTSLGNEVFKDIPAIIFGDHTRVFKYIDFPFCLGADGTKLLEINKKIANSKYIYYFFKTLNIPNTGYNRHFKYLKKIKIPLPLMDVQIKIANILDKAQELIDNKKVQLDKYDELLQSIFMNMFGNPVTNSKGWETKILSEIGEFKNGLNYREKEKGEVIKFLGVSEFKKNLYLNSTEKLPFLELDILPSEDYLLQKFDLIFVRSNGSKELVGRSILVKNIEEDTSFSGFCIRYRNKFKGLNMIFFRNLLEVKSFKTYLKKDSRGANINNLNQKMLSNLIIILPPLPLQEKFASIAEKIEEEKRACEESLKRLEENFNSIMDRAFKGELF